MSVEYAIKLISHLREGMEDYVGFWEIVRDANELSQDSLNFESKKEIALQMVHDLVAGGHMKLGDLKRIEGTNFEEVVPWELELDDMIRRIELEWKELGREPYMWEICFLETTEEGKQALQDGGLEYRGNG